VKLDRSLIADVARNPRVSRLVGSMLHTARALGVSIVAEGVEDEGQALFLRAAGCDRMQGYLFARPMPAEAMEARLLAEALPGTAPRRRVAG
jgi:EAL domain-containing protein (putative c-di-GMP-specific phosphodiesterase class I)